MAAWMKPSELRPGAGVQLKDTSGNFGAALSRDGEGRYVFYVQAGDGSYRGPTSKTLAQDGEWAHVTAVFEEGCMGLYIKRRSRTRCATTRASRQPHVRRG